MTDRIAGETTQALEDKYFGLLYGELKLPYLSAMVGGEYEQ